MARCVERQLADPTSGTASVQKRSGTSRPKLSPFPTFDQIYFNLGLVNGPIRRDDRVRNNRPINICRNLIPQVDTPFVPSHRRQEAKLQAEDAGLLLFYQHSFSEDNFKSFQWNGLIRDRSANELYRLCGLWKVSPANSVRSR